MYELQISFNNFHTIKTYMKNMPNLDRVIREAKYQASITPIDSGVTYRVSNTDVVLFEIAAYEPVKV